MTKMLSVRLEDRLIEAVDAAGRSEGRGRSEVVREALELWLRRRRVQEQVNRHRRGYARRPVAEDEFEPVFVAQRWPK